MTAIAESTRLLRLGHSPDADDAFMFYGLATGKVSEPGLRFEHLLRDIQTLNDWAREGRLECTAISVHAYAYVADKYALLAQGASMGEDWGPMVVSKSLMDAGDLAGKRIAVPGLLTSAYLELRLAVPDFEPVVVPFDRCMDAVDDGRAEAALLIHEGQLTHRERGFRSVMELWTWWRELTGLPLPLGANAIRRDLSPEVRTAAARALRDSIQYALDHREEALDHALQYARDLPRATADRFVGMYVNQRTLDLGEDGRAAYQELLDRGAAAGLIPAVGRLEFVD
ncbi:MAG TPA: MqnA/MqnD/SBP family protein [Candidatus Dormibacteraeota bacterium]|jgi:1,4-dihydroxy-6-naphthoate synthase|nr:MqnA/MqnD/SBP family protein [Candidatus Dormibacteraeota bacterium]